MPQSDYITLACRRLRQIDESQRESIRAAGALLAEAVRQDRLIYLFGAGGHTSLAVGELFFRVGGFANIYPITELGLSALGRARQFIELERCPALGAALVRAGGLGAGDVLVIFHTIGVTGCCVEAALEAKRLGASVIGAASGCWQTETPPGAALRHPSGKNLRDVADVAIDDNNSVDDAALTLPGLDAPVGPLSGIGTFAVAHLLELEAMRQCLQSGIAPPVWRNANTPQGAAQNRALMERFAPRVPAL